MNDANTQHDLVVTDVELIILGNALNEVCHGIRVDADELRALIGVDKSEARRLLTRIKRLYDDLARRNPNNSAFSTHLQLGDHELRILTNSLNEVCSGPHIGDYEFHARLGVDRDEAQTLLERVRHFVVGESSAD